MPKTNNYHLFVLIHGLWGTYKHLDSLVRVFGETIEEKDEKLLLYAPRVNAKFKTFDGIEILGYRTLIELCEFIDRFKASHPNATINKISVLGYSLGGLVARFVVGKMFTDCHEYFHEMQPVVFITMASPHLGVKFYNPLSARVKTVVNPLLRFLGSTILGKSGRELFIINDSNDIVIRMTEGEYLEGLARFKWRVAFANVKNDRTVAFYTSFITGHDPFLNTGNTIAYSFETKIPGRNYRYKGVRIIDMNLLDPEKTRPKTVTPMTYSRFLRIVSFVLLAVFFFFPMAFIMNTGGTIYSHFATAKYRRWLRTGEITEKFRKRVGITEQVNEYISNALERIATYEMGSGETEERDDSLETDTIDATDSNLKQWGVSKSRRDDVALSPECDTNENEDEMWAQFIGKYSSITNGDRDWTHRFKPLPLDSKRNTCLKNLGSLDWIRVPVYIKSFNAHAGIVARRGLDEDKEPMSAATVEFTAKLLNYLFSHENKR